LRLLRLLAVLFVAAGVAAADGHPFDDVVRAIEKHYGATRTRIPGMGWANLALTLSHPAGAREVHIAIFKDLHVEPDEPMDRFMRTLESAELRPLIRTKSSERGDAVYIFHGELGKTTQLLIATFSGRQETVVEVRVDVDTLMRWIQSPDEWRGAGESQDR
jgi:hypothetical protein